jgi:hypothetical protein
VRAYIHNQTLFEIGREKMQIEIDYEKIYLDHLLYTLRMFAEIKHDRNKPQSLVIIRTGILRR